MTRAQRDAFVAAYVAEQGLTVLDYMGPPIAYVAWERRQEMRRSVNRASTLRLSGRGPNPSRDLFGLPRSGPRVTR